MGGKRVQARAILATIALAVGGILAPSTQPPAAAADLSGFRPGNIISDELFFNGYWMTEGAIQSFLQAKGSSCSIGADGSACLKDYRMTTVSQPADARCPGGYVGAVNERASTIIAKVSQSCGINPEVIIVMLQKEEGLVTTSGAAATATRYRTAMGYGCPDSSVCDAKYYGFFNQVYRAAWQFRSYALSPSSFSHRAKAWNTILFNPSSSCGSSSVYIENQATAGLYNYTPYQPNAAVLSGRPNSCSAYGNLNFWNYFTDWFGPTYGWAVRDSVRALWNSTGGARGPLGVPVAAEVCDSTGCTQKFSSAVVAWSSTTPPQAIGGDILTLWQTMGGTGSDLGYPTTTALWCDGNAGCVQQFTGGLIGWSYATGAQAATGEIAVLWNRLGGSTSGLGLPTATIGRCDGTVGCEQSFQGGAITWSWATGAQAMSGALLALWHSQGGAGSPLGYPTSTPPVHCDGAAGCYQTFSDGIESWSAATGAQAMFGAIATRWVELGGAASGLGYPTETIAPCTASAGCSQSFQGGAIAWSAASGAQALTGEFLRRWRAVGDLGSSIGYPTSTPPIHCDGQVGCSQTFTDGVMTWSWATGARVVKGDFATAWSANTGAKALGWAIRDVDTSACRAGSVCIATFTGGLLVRPADGSAIRPIGGAIAQLWSSLGADTSWLGVPTSSVVLCDGAAGCTQTFTGGSISWTSRTGAQAMPTTVAATWTGFGGSSSDLGYPVATPAASCSTTGGCVQQFEGGIITWSSTLAPQVLTGEFAKRWLSVGGTSSDLGLATSTVGRCDGNVGCVQTFEHGAISWSWSTGTQIVNGAFYTLWKSLGPMTSSLGLPTSTPALRCDGAVGCEQQFQGGVMTWSWATGAQAVASDLEARWRASGANATLGLAATTVIPCPTSGCVQSFQHGAVTWSPSAGAQAINGAFLAFWQGQGGAASDLGLPTSTPPFYCDGRVGCSQSFEHGVLSWSAAGGVKRS